MKSVEDSKMILLIIFGVSSLSSIGLGSEVCPTCIFVGEKCYNSTYLFDLEARYRKDVVIHEIGVLRSKNTLFFSFEPEIEDIEYYKTGFVNLDNTSQIAIISNNLILNFGTFDIDQVNEMVYFGGSDGIFVLDSNNSQMAWFSSRGDFVTNVFYKNHIYFTRYNDKGVIVKIGNNFKTHLDYIAVKKFVVHKTGVFVYFNTTGLFVSKDHGSKRLSKNSYFRGLTIDLDDNVYAWWIDGIYKISIEKNIHESKIEKIAKLEGIGAMTFENQNNILFTNSKALYRLAPTDSGC